jgi:hypothetical protein
MNIDEIKNKVFTDSTEKIHEIINSYLTGKMILDNYAAMLNN